MIAHAALIAEKLQGAHERRQRNGREDEDMGKDEATTEQVQQFGSSVWDDDPFVHAMKLNERMGKVLADIAASGHAPGDPQASAVSAERVVELERQLADAQHNAQSFREQAESGSRALQDALVRVEVLEEGERQRAERGEVAELEHLLATAYVPREVPWSDMAAGMMTISAQGEAWMVDRRGDDWVDLTSGPETFHKTPAPGETVRVLVPYVTPEAAASAVREQLGGTEVS
jgi:hypothetical protein